MSSSLDKVFAYGNLGKLLLRIATKSKDEFPAPAPKEDLDGNESSEARRLVQEMEKLGPTVIKFGQILSTRNDLLPADLALELKRLQDDVAPVPFNEIELVLVSEFGVPVKKLFKQFDKEPLATASLGQVHQAELMDGTKVAVKVQKPGIINKTRKDIRALEKMVHFLEEHSESFRRYDIRSVLEEFKQNIFSELDYQEEMANLKRIKENLSRFSLIRLPKVYESYTTTKVLTMEFLEGEKLSNISQIAKTEVHGDVLLQELFKAYLQQIFVDGVFHSDPHLGNIFYIKEADGEKLGIIDLGMVTRISPKMREKLLQFLINASEGNAQEAADLAESMTIPIKGIPQEADSFKASVANTIKEYQDRSVGQTKTGNILFKVATLGAKNGFSFPQEMTSIGRTLIYLDEVASILDPNFNPQKAVRENALEYLQRSQTGRTSLSHLLYEAVEMKNLIEELPRKASSILDKTLKGKLEIKVNAFEQEKMMQGFQKIANRVALGLILAAMIVGSSRLMSLESSFQIFGYPGLAMILLLLACVGSLCFIIYVWWGDE